MTSNIHQILFRAAICLLSALAVVLTGCSQNGDRGSEPAVSADDRVTYAPVPEWILTPDSVETRLGTLEFFDGYPSTETVETVLDNLDFQHGVRAFLVTVPIALTCPLSLPLIHPY